MKLPIILVLTTLSCVTSNADEKNLKLLVKHIKSLRGVSKCNVFLENNVKDKRIVSKLLTKLTKSLPIVSIKNGTSSWPKSYVRTNFARQSNFHVKSREQRGLMNCASANALLIYVSSPSLVSFTKYCDMLISLTRTFYTLAMSTSIPKVLFVNVATRKFYRCKAVFNDLITLVDLEILDLISNGEPRGKMKVKNCQKHINFIVHSCNNFAGKYKIRKLLSIKSNNCWFQDKLKDLRGCAIFTNQLRKFVKAVTFNGKRYQMNRDTESWYSNLGIYLSDYMNFTFVKSPMCEVAFPMVQLSRHNDDNMNYLKVCEFETYQLYTPVIMDVQVKEQLSNFLICSIALPLILLMLHWFSVMGGFDRRTWSTLAIFKMLLGLNNPRDPKLLLESFVFILLSICGLFSANDFYESVTSIIVPVQLERRFHTIEDLKLSNLTLYIQGSRCASSNDPIFKLNRIDETGVRFNVTSNKLKRELLAMGEGMLLRKNVAVSIAKCTASFQYYESNVRVGDRVTARMSDMTEDRQAISLVLAPYSPFREKLSEAYWRFRESGFTNFDQLTLSVKRAVYEYLNAQMSLLEDEEFGAEAIDDFTETILLVLIVVGLVMPLLLLIVEIITFARLDIYYFILLRF